MVHNEASKDELEECFFCFWKNLVLLQVGIAVSIPIKKQIVLFQNSCTPSDEALIMFF